MKRFIPLFALFIIVGALLACGESSTGSTTNSTSASSAPTKSGTWTTTHTFTGNGGKKTESFTVGDDWKIQWTCNPGSMGMDAPFFVTPYKVDGNVPLDSGAQTTCKAGQDTKGETEEHEGGTVYIDINSGIDWTVTIQEMK